MRGWIHDKLIEGFWKFSIGTSSLAKVIDAMGSEGLEKNTIQCAILSRLCT